MIRTLPLNSPTNPMAAISRQGPGAFSRLTEICLICLGLLVGFGGLSISPLWTVAGLVVALSMIGLFKWPELLPLAFLVITSTVIRVDQAPSLSIGFGTLYITDILLLIATAYISLSLLTKADFKLVRTPLDLPLVAFWAASLISTVSAIAVSSLPWKQSLHESRVVTGYLLFFVVTNLVRNKKQLAHLISGLIYLATAVAIVTIVQHFFGHSLLVLTGRIETFDGITRVILPGQSIIMIALTAVFAMLVFDKATTLRFFQCGLLATAMAITFFRASWVVAGLSMMVIAFSARGREARRVILCSVAATAIGTICLLAILAQPDSRGSRAAVAASQRLETLFDSRTFQDRYSSLRWRDFEYKYAFPRVISHPLLGLGLGAYYRPLTSKDHKDFDGRAFIHNGHLYVLLKAGGIAYLALIFFTISALVRGLKFWKLIEDGYMKGIVLAFALTFMEVIVVSIVEPYMMQMPWTPVIGIMAGINESAFRLFRSTPSTPVKVL